MSGPSDDALTGVAGDPPGTAATADSITETKPPSRRDAIIRIGIVAGVLSIVFGVILPRFVDYRQVLNALQGLSLQDFLVVGIFGLITWVLTGAIFTALIPGLGLVRGLDAYLILTGIGASIPLGPWNMAVLWVVIRGWGRPVSTTTGGILLYGIFDQLSRFGLMFIAGIVLVVAESAASAWPSRTPSSSATSCSAGCSSSVSGSGSSWSSARSAWRASSGSWPSASSAPSSAGSGGRCPDVEGALVRFRITLGDTVRERGVVAFLVAMASKFAWFVLMIVSMRVVGITERELPASIILAGVAGVFVITVLPIAPGGAGVPEVLYISFFTAYTGGADSSVITAGVMLFRAFQWALPIPLAWILLGMSRRGKPLLPTKAEFQARDSGPVAAGA